MDQHAVRVAVLRVENKTDITPRAYATIIIATYVVLIAGAEALTVLGWIALGLFCHLALVVALVNHYALSGRVRYRRVLPVLALVSLLRVLSWTMAVPSWPQVSWYALASVPALMATALTARFLDVPAAKLGLQLRSWQEQLPIAASGLPLSFAAFLLLRPRPLFADLYWNSALIGSVVLIVFVAFVEEILFRGLLQRAAVQVLGSGGLLVSSELFVVAYIGSLSVTFVVLMALVGLFFGWCVRRTGSIWGVVLAHSLWVIGALMIWPLLWR